MAIKLRKNVYNGVNAHLHSSLQNEDSAWEVFHSAHVTDIAVLIDKTLPEGYIVEPERSLQIRKYDASTGEPIFVRRKYPKPDVTIYETSPQIKPSTKTHSLTTTPTLTLPAIESIDDDEDSYLRSVVIRELKDNKIGRAVTWIELLSPTNKPPGEGYLQYREKRNSTLHSGIVLVEIDYLHQTHSPIKGVKHYPEREAGAFPYSIVVTDPRPNLRDGIMDTYGLNVDQDLPIIDIPLNNNDVVPLDFSSVYNQTFENLRAFSYRVDYDQVPEKFDSYTPDDQKRILAVMGRAKTVAANPQNG